jgi:hypothetical protein
MKRLVQVALILWPAMMFAQDRTGYTIFHNTISVLIDSSETRKVYLGFFSGRPRGGATIGFDSSAINPNDEVEVTGDLTFFIRMDSLVVSAEKDSLSGYALELTHDGYAADDDTLWFDWPNYTTGSTQRWTAWVPFNRDSTGFSMKIALTNKYDPCFGFEIGFIQAAADSNGTGSGMISRGTIDTAEVR